MIEWAFLIKTNTLVACLAGATMPSTAGGLWPPRVAEIGSRVAHNLSILCWVFGHTYIPGVVFRNLLVSVQAVSFLSEQQRYTTPPPSQKGSGHDPEKIQPWAVVVTNQFDRKPFL